MDRAPMPLTTNDDPTTEEFGVPARTKIEPDDQSTSGKVGDQSGYDVVTSAASPRPLAAPTRWDRFVLFNIAIPILLVLAGVQIVRMLGVAEAKPALPPDTSRAAYMSALKETRVERIRSLEETDQQLELVIDGTVVPYQEAQVSAEVAGRVIDKSENCEAGAIVNKGDVLMQIDRTDYQQEFERLTQEKEREYRFIGEVDQEMINAKRSIDLAREDVKLQQKEVDRQKALKRFASDTEVDRAKGALLQASQQLVTLENQVDLLRSRRSRLEASEQLVAKQLEVAELNLARCEIKAPISGVIVSEQADLNTFVNRGTPLVTIEDTSKVEVAASMRMDQLPWVLDQKVSTEPSSDESSGGQGAGYDLPDTEAIIEYEVAGRKNTVHRWKGTLVSYAGIGIDPKTRTVPVRLLVDNPTNYVDEDGEPLVTDRTNALVRGMFVRVRLLLNPKSGLVVIPANALRPGNKVWRFQCDDSVIDEMMAKDKQNRDQVQLVDDSVWSAGTVKFSKSVYPIESLRLETTTAIESKTDPSKEIGGEAETDRSLSSSLQPIRRYWVCEAVEGDLSAGDYVVVSPLDSVPSEGLPARAKIKS